LANIAKEYRQVNNYHHAELAYRHAMAVAPNTPNSFVNFGSMLSTQKRYLESEKV